MLEAGLTHEKEIVITEDMSAISMHSGGLMVFATPSMIALMEETALECVAPHLEEGMGTVGTLVNVTHDAPTPIGMKARAKATLTEVSGRKLVFSVEAYDEAGIIGRGTHERFIIDNERFQVKCNAKQNG